MCIINFQINHQFGIVHSVTSSVNETQRASNGITRNENVVLKWLKADEGEKERAKPDDRLIDRDTSTSVSLFYFSSLLFFYEIIRL